MLTTIDADIKLGLDEKTYEFLFADNDYEAILAEELYAQLKGSEKLTEIFYVEIERLKLANPEIMQLSSEKAETLFLVSLLELMKYNIDPELNAIGGK